MGIFNKTTYFAFPSLEQLAKTGVEQKLRELGFGYRYWSFEDQKEDRLFAPSSINAIL